MKRRLIAMFLTLCLLSVLIPTSLAAGYGSEVNTDNIVEGGKRLYASKEGNYDSVVASDGGAVGMGILGWRGAKALELMKMICEKAPSYSKDVLGSAFYNEIVNAGLTAWNNRTFNDSEKAKAKTLISSSYGVAAQNELARTDIIRQIGEAWDEGIRSDAAILYYCSISNHYGPYGASNNFMPDIRAALGITKGQTIDTLEIFHNAVLKAAQTSSYVNNTLSYRKDVYNFIKYTLGWDTNGGPSTAVTPLTFDGGSGSGSETQPATGDFIDVPLTYWGLEGIQFVTNKGLFQGTSSTTFDPEMSMTRAMFVTVLYRMAGQPSLIGVSIPRYTDVQANTWYYPAVIWANARGIVKGVTSTTFCPDTPITREQLAVILYRYAEYYKSLDKAYKRTDDLTFNDSDLVSDYAKTALEWAISRGYINGIKNDGVVSLDPQGTATRAQVATIIMRYVRAK